MNVTREIVKDLLPLYAAGEASADTRAAVEEWLRTDPELARLAQELREDAPPPAVTADPESGRSALAATKSLLRRRAHLLAAAWVLTGLPFSFAFDGSHVRFLMLRDAPLACVACWVGAALLWIAFARTSRRLKVTGL